MPSTLPARRAAFFAWDRARGGVKSAHVEDVESIVSDPTSTRSLARRQAQVEELLTHAGSTVPFYRDLGVGGATDLRELPVVDKGTFFSDPSAMKSTAYNIDELPKVHTSGSTGTPLTIPRDPVKWNRHVADLVVFGRMVGHDWGEPMVFLTVTRGLNGRSLNHRFQGIRYVTARQYDDEVIENALRAIVQSPKPLTLAGGPSALEFLGRSLQASGRELPTGTVKNVIGVGEGLTPWLEHSGADVFGGAVLSRYSNQENGILAHQTPTSSRRFVVNHASYVVEVLDLNEDRPAAPGALGRIVVTDLYARAAPLIRYDTDDLGRWSGDNELELAEVVGRSVDVIYSVEGKPIAPIGLMVRLYGIHGVEHYRFAQTGESTYLLTLVGTKDPERDSAIVASLQESLGTSAEITVEYVDELDVLPSGKRRPVTNLWARAQREAESG